MNGNTDRLININLARVLRLVWQKKETTRIEMAQELGLHKSTITNIINDMIARGIVYESATGASGPQGGRKPIYLMINKHYGCAAGFEVQASYWRLVIINLDGEILAEHVSRERIDADNLLKVLSGSFAYLQARVKKLKTRLLGVGIGTSGIMNPDRGEILQSIPLSIREPLAVAAPLSAAFGVPVHIDNDANCCAWGELTFNKGLALSNFISLLLEIREEELERKTPGGLAVGLGIVIDGKVHYGSTFSAGEFRSVFSQKTDISQFSLAPRELLKLNSDRAAFRRFAEELAENIALLVNVLNVSHVYLSIFNVKFKDDIIPVLKARIADKFPYTIQRECQVALSSFGDKGVAYGAAGFILEHIFAPSDLPKAGDEYGLLDTGATVGPADVSSSGEK
jgi:predicted NBD/HSP70 family sugar kinase